MKINHHSTGLAVSMETYPSRWTGHATDPEMMKKRDCKTCTEKQIPGDEGGWQISMLRLLFCSLGDSCLYGYCGD
jgi:hypothetical protein